MYAIAIIIGNGETVAGSLITSYVFFIITKIRIANILLLEDTGWEENPLANSTSNRDGLQNKKGVIPVDVKVRLLRRVASLDIFSIFTAAIDVFTHANLNTNFQVVTASHTRGFEGSMERSAGDEIDVQGSTIGSCLCGFVVLQKVD
ncbi:hypothetical protein C0995_004440 [Termitomyces sp. Mi166|nr:hypothetical protein C0995_004440 [Termitomyces sp. Mi166\